MLNQYRIYTDTTCTSAALRSYLADILRPLINRRTRKQNREVYGAVVDQYVLVDDISLADWVVLPFAWNYYHHNHKLHQALEFIARAREVGKPILTWINGDFGARVPVSDVGVFGAAGYRSRMDEMRFGTPVFIRDPLPELDLKAITVRTKKELPLIGFCGYAQTTVIKSVGFVIRALLRNIASLLHLTGDEPQELYPSIHLRQRILESLNKAPQIETDFIPRSQYKAGAYTELEERMARQTFLENICDTDYTVCVRGGGNFSARLYETLAMGRIPVFVDTDCILPYSSDPHWRECCVYIERNEIPYISEKIRDFHGRFSENDFMEIQHTARRFWEERLSFNGFFAHFSEHINQ